jgi:hypothetical protein
VQTVKEDLNIADVRVLVQGFYHLSGYYLTFLIGGVSDGRESQIHIDAAFEIMQGYFLGSR